MRRLLGGGGGGGSGGGGSGGKNKKGSKDAARKTRSPDQRPPARLTSQKMTLPDLHWFVMTSHFTDAATRAYFAEKAFFGLGRGNVTFFQQAMLPCFTPGGKIILKSKCEVG
jgi:hypothetical protein